MPQLALRPRTASEIIDASANLTRTYGAPLVSIAALSVLAALPVTLSQVVLGPERLPFGIPTWVGDLYTSAVGSLAFSAAVAGAEEAVRGGRVPSPGAALLSVLRRPATFVLIGVIMTFGFMLGLLLLVVPGLLLMGRWSVAFPAAVRERLGPIAALERSAELARGYRGKTVRTMLLSTIIYAAVVGAVVGLVTLLGYSHWWPLAMGVAGLPFTPFMAFVVVILYYDLRVLREGYDIEAMADGLFGNTLSEAPPPGARLTRAGRG